MLAALRRVKASHRLEWEDRGFGAERKSVQDEREPPHQTRIHVSPSLKTIDSLNDLVKY